MSDDRHWRLVEVAPGDERPGDLTDDEVVSISVYTNLGAGENGMGRSGWRKIQPAIQRIFAENEQEEP